MSIITDEMVEAAADAAADAIERKTGYDSVYCEAIARAALAVAAPLIAQAEREACAERGDAVAAQYGLEAGRALDAGDMPYAERLAQRGSGAREVAATIRVRSTEAGQ